MRLALLLALLGLFDGLAEDRIDQEQHLAVGGLAALRHHVLVHVLAIGLHRLDALGVDDDGVGVGGGELAAARRAAGLGDHRLALRRRPGVQRPARAEILALVIDGMDLGGIDQHARLAVGDDRARLPRAPQAAAHLHVFVGHVVAQVVVGHALHAEIHRRKIRAAGDGVPADAAARHLVERRHQAGQQVGVIGVCSESRNDADARCHLGHQRRHHRGILARHGDGVLEVDLGRAAEAFADIGRIFEQDVVEAGAFQRARHVEEQLGLHPVLADMARPGFAPGLRARPLEEPREMKRFAGHGSSSTKRVKCGCDETGK